MRAILNTKLWVVTLGMLLLCAGATLAQNVFPSNGNVGVGTATPQNQLDVVGNAATIRLQTTNSQNAGLNFFDSTGALRASIGYNVGSNVMMLGSAGNPQININASGRVGIGTMNPQNMLDVVGNAATIRLQTTNSQNPGVNFFDSTGALKASIGYAVGTDTMLLGWGGFPHVVIDKNGKVGIGTATPTNMFHVAGDVRVDGNIAAKYQDVAEWVKAGPGVSAASVVVIDPSEFNRVITSSQPYDTRVAGVVSAQPGLLLGEEGADKAKVAHSGRVKVKVDAQYGAIGAGDLLVSSPTPGYAMRSEPVALGGGTSIHRPGTLIGKALEPMADGQGEILVLLMLQ